MLLFQLFNPFWHENWFYRIRILCKADILISNQLHITHFHWARVALTSHHTHKIAYQVTVFCLEVMSMTNTQMYNFVTLSSSILKFSKLFQKLKFVLTTESSSHFKCFKKHPKSKSPFEERPVLKNFILKGESLKHRKKDFGNGKNLGYLDIWPYLSHWCLFRFN